MNSLLCLVITCSNRGVVTGLSNLPFSPRNTSTAHTFIGRQSNSYSLFSHHGATPRNDKRNYATLDKPRRHWVVPFGRNRDFVGRKALVARLLEKIPRTQIMMTVNGRPSKASAASARRRSRWRPPLRYANSIQTARSSGFQLSAPPVSRTRIAR